MNIKKFNFIYLLLTIILIGSCELTSSFTSSIDSNESSSSIASYPAYFKPEGYKILSDIYKGVMPSTGDVNVLVIPIDFYDYPRENVTVSLMDLHLTFFGKDYEVEWESVSSYYYKSSYGKLNISGQVTPWYRASNLSTNYQDGGINNLYKLFDEIMKEVSNEDWFIPSNYDSDNDGYFDGVYFIYSTPIMTNTSNLWWAFTGEFKSSNYYNGLKLGKYVFAGIDFVSYNQDAKLDSTVYIHETGHLLGLDDYYDYNDDIGPRGGIGKTDMMENNIGDHSSLSKILLGWVTPTVVTNSASITIDSLVNHEDVILVTNAYHDSVFDEYLLIDVYDPIDLNTKQYDAYGYNCKSTLTKKGVRIYHIDTKLGSGSIYGLYYYYTLFAKNNTSTSTKLIKLIEADGGNEIETQLVASNSDLFMDNDVFNENGKYRLYNLELFKFSIEIKENKDGSYQVNLNYL